MTAPATCKIGQTLRELGSTIAATARQLSRSRVLWTVVGITVLLALASLLPLPSPVQMRDWARSLGPWFPLAFFLTHIVATVVPVPRTAFTVAAGLLFGPALGIAIAVVASATSAMIAMLLFRATGWRLNRVVRHRSIETVDARLRQRGWLAIMSLRLIPAVPFAALNYAAGASTVRVLPYGLATLAGLLPGTAAVVILGDALTGHPSALFYLASGITSALGLGGLVVEVRHFVRHHRRTRDPARDDGAAPEPAVVG
ncbi:TVP38/TMEM64 family protein [Mycobacterium parmense]|uniref:TVP38/TMEM64 family membrane protein n=1 Tax=Mycobacterium parmense TaxID=185642 RepID=A0A7I7YS71_9MYCO|nr:TVP38/TMEM64 family protein [Mycobacterium parmense]MCV7351947.1 TVP38/TMEM64 family protein [Mycobacterium parmense]ORW56659.1 hypothetical protein AWC20_02130 [Mycobacterium parmense]BBZ44580.1 TVP38/TMEM64 family membrane protein [Mycobacterium parmense]